MSKNISKVADIAAMAPTYKAPKPITKGRATGQAFAQSKSFYDKGFGTPKPPPLSKTSFWNVVKPMAAAAGRGLVGMAAGAGASTGAKAVNYGVRAGVTAGLMAKTMNQNDQKKMMPKIALDILETVLKNTDDQNKYAMAQMFEPSDITLGRVLFYPLKDAGILQIDE